MLDEVARAVKVAQILDDALKSWCFDAFALAELTNNKPLSTLGLHLFHHLGFMEHFDLDVQKVERFFIEIELGYCDETPYHNRAHAASVLHSMHALLEQGGIMKAVAPAFDTVNGSTYQNGQVERMACLLAAAIHDFEHLGVSNDFLVRTCHQRAMMYNDQHVNEHHHVAAAYSVLSRPECDFLENFSQAEWRRLRNVVIELVISTDMANGGKILKSFNEAFGIPAEISQAALQVPTTEKEATLLLQMAIKCADLGHLALKWDVHRQWVSKLEDEFFAQGDREKALGHPVSFLMDRTKPGCSKTQTGFFKFVVIPLFRSLVAVAPQAQPVLDAVMNNYRDWQTLEAGGVNQTEGNEEADVGAVVQQSGEGAVQSTEPTRTLSNDSLGTAADETPQGRKSPKRSGRARQRAAKWWAAVRRNTPSPERVLPQCAFGATQRSEWNGS